ncbi:MAG TPA: glutaredoxin domain-containing protein, partial [Burkholderiales bacterium]|nr:glutaredoxin domain-containing protein [Burkholderiales bacterium]
MAPLRVYWRPGCSSCVKVKEFLSGLGVDYESINVSARPEAMDELREMGVRTVPVVARGRDYVFAQELADVSQFIGRKVDFERLAPEALMRKWRTVLAAAQRHALQIPPDRLGERATEGRDRSIRDLAYHVYQVPDAFLQAIEGGVQDLTAVYNAPPPAGVKTPADIRDYGRKVSERLERWWQRDGHAVSRSSLETYYGVQPLHYVMERSVWHSAQHARQIAAVLERLGIEPEGPLTQQDYAGLPMPKGLW